MSNVTARLSVLLITALVLAPLAVLSAPSEALAGCRFEMVSKSFTEKKVVGGQVKVSTSVKRERVMRCNAETPVGARVPPPTSTNIDQAKKQLAAWDTRLDEYQICRRSDTLSSPATCGAPPKAPQFATVEGMIGVPEIRQLITPQAAAYMAVAELNLTAPKPGIGPSPTINPWKIAAVGYPYWFWADGTTNPAPVTDTVADLTVTLDAKIEKVVFRTGDGNTVTCRGAGTPWTTRVRAGTESPTCGYRWAKPAPRKTYTVTATTHWAVAWTAAGQSGTIPIVQQSSTPFPVGELHVVVR